MSDQRQTRGLGRWLGLGRSLVVYYGIPLRARRLTRFYSQFVVPGSLCFDIGAHAGNRIRCWRRLGARVIAVEPQTDFVRILRAFYGSDPDVCLVAAAVGRNEGTARLLTSARTPTVSTLSAAWARRVEKTPGFQGVSWSDGGSVQVTTLDALIARYGLPRFAKIDVEGYEADVLTGLSVAIPTLSIEYLPAVRQVALDCIDRLSVLGRYRYNWSVGESHRLAAPGWLNADAVRRVIAGLPERAGSGDIYARLENA